MPYYLGTDDRELLKKLRLANTCAECGGELEAMWDGFQKLPFLQCRNVPLHNGISKPNKKEDNSYEGGIKQMLQVQRTHGEEKARKLAKYQGVTTLSRIQAMEILDTIWPTAPAPEKLAAAILCQSYGLNPLANHIFLIPYDKKDKDGNVISTTWARVWGIRAKRLVASRKGGYSYLDMSPRLMTEAEQVKVWGKADTANLCFITILKDTTTGAEVFGFGKWPLTKTWGNKTYPNEPKGTDKGNSMENMCSIRSEAQALDRLRPAEMPNGDGVVDEQFVEVEGQTVEKTTGQVIEGEAKEISEPPPDAPPAAEADQDFATMSEESKRIEAEERWGFVQADWLKTMLKSLNWTPKDCGQWIERALKVTGKTLREVVSKLTEEQAKALIKEINDRIEM